MRTYSQLEAQIQGEEEMEEDTEGIPDHFPYKEMQRP